MVLTLTFSVIAMIAIVAGRYFAVSGGFAWLTNRMLPDLYRGRAAQIRSEILWSISGALIYAIPAGVLAWGWQERGWTQIYSDVSDFPWWWLPISVFVYLFLHDSWFFWTHRLMHVPSIYKRMHAVHHASREPTAWAAMSFHPWESISGAILVPALVLTIPIHYGALLVVLSVMTIMGVTNHMGWELFPRWIVHGPLGRWLITASHHQLHHEKYLCNFGLYFRFWDRLCGTDRGLGDFSVGRPQPLRQS
jgi:sterol desaturase/sphingolipid hydroxylase (fatty acid hydroxylase superfamily)